MTAAALADVVSIMERCGRTNAIAKSFAKQNGISSLNDCMFVCPKMTAAMVKDFNYSRKADQKLGMFHTIKFKAFIY